MSIGLPSTAPPSVPPISAPLAHAGILVVDEDPAFQLGLKTFLREYVGFEKVCTAASGQAALDQIYADPSIEVVTLDYRMPGLSGIDVMRDLSKNLTRPLSVLMITGYPSDELEREFYSLATPKLLACRFLTKPVAFEKLEPLLLRAHEEFLTACQPVYLATEEVHTNSGEQAGVTAAIPEGIALSQASLAAHSERIAALEEEVHSLRGKWRRDFFRVALLVLGLWLAGQFGIYDKLAPSWKVGIEWFAQFVTEPFTHVKKIPPGAPTSSSSSAGTPVSAP
jgi:CheY-like chemotaxis protein